ncbi:transcriptional antiterminator [Meridianimarinicoccus roseus]|uniref:Transcriptional antiterminator n=1 Tax=Meridianimarinicoccus roseus TaxID=2072018 RepID=A0A2V2LQ27_9RHOB|nr:transcriptional antiterminator [Meridianimarinicoccus roseus]PWR04319.1 transcriptional antiterminator [Meridianimarinicoccus roseus]
MMLTHNFTGMTAAILHPSADVRAAIVRRLDVLGVAAEGRWPALEEEDRHAGLAIVDIDRAEDSQFPWEAGHAPMPVVGLIGSESPGRLGWAIEFGIDAFLPLGALGNLYSALVIAFAQQHRRKATTDREADLARRAAMRLDVVRAVLRLMTESGIDEATALKKLRAFAMVERLPLEDAARRYLDTAAPGRAGHA